MNEESKEKVEIFDELNRLLDDCDIDADDVVCSKIVAGDTYECTVAPSGRLYHDECKAKCEAIAALLTIIQRWNVGGKT